MVMIVNEQGFWRLVIALGIGGVAMFIAATIRVVARDPAVPLAAGAAAAATAYGIDWYTENKSKPE